MTKMTGEPCWAVIMNPDGSGGSGLLKDTRLETLQGIVGGLIEPIRVHPGVTAWVNEEGLLLDLEVNVQASLTLGVLSGDPSRPMLVVGPVLFLGASEDGQIDDLPGWFVPMLEALFEMDASDKPVEDTGSNLSTLGPPTEVN